MERKTCTICNFEKDITNFYKRYTECKNCNRTRGLKRYYEKKEEMSNQQKVYYEKTRDKNLLQKRNSRRIQSRDIVISFVELDTKLKALEDEIKRNGSEKH